MKLNKLPNLIETIDFSKVKNDFLLRARDIKHWNAELESDPVVKLLEICAYREMSVRARVNHVARSNLVHFATESDLDACASFYGITRLANEDDNKLRDRLFKSIFALAGNGTKQHYEARALASSSEITGVSVYSPRGGEVVVAVWLRDILKDEKEEDYNLKMQSALNSASKAIKSKSTQMLGVDIQVYEAKIESFSVTAKVFVESVAPLNIQQLLEQNFRTKLEAEQQIGEDLSLSLLSSFLHQDFVDKVVMLEPTADVVTARDSIYKLASLNLEIVRDN